MYVRSTLLSLAALAGAREVAKDEFKAAKLYDSGIKHANNIALKMVRTTYLACILALTVYPGNLQ
jgi:hypothetical protein